MVTPETPPEPAAAPPRRKRRHVHSFLWWVGHVLMAVPVVIVGLLAVGYWRLSEGPIQIAPLGHYIEARINAISQDQKITVGGARLAHGDTNLSARVFLDDITVSAPDGRVLLTLPQVSSQVEWLSLLKRDPRLYSIEVDGVLIDFVRQTDGSVNFTSPLLQDATQDTGGGGNFTAILQNPLLSKLQDFQLNNAVLTYFNQRSGKFWLADEGSVVINTSDNAIDLRATLSLPARQDGLITKSEISFTRQLSDDFSNIHVSFENADPQDLANEFPAIDWLRVLDTTVSGDLGGQLLDSGQIDDLAGVLSVGQGRVIAPPSDDIIGFDEAKVYFTYDGKADKLELSEWSLLTSFGFFTAEGAAELSRNPDGLVENIAADLKFSDVLISRPDLFEGPLQFSEGTAKLVIDLAPFSIELVDGTVRDDTTTYQLSGSSFAAADNWVNAYDLAVDILPKAKLTSLWPVGSIPKTRKWVKENILSGNIERLRGSFWNTGPAVNFQIDFGLDKIESRFMRTMPHIKGGFGAARLTNSFLQIDLSGGTVMAPNGADINLAGSSLFIEDIKMRPAIGDIHLRTKSDVAAALSLMNLPPFGYLDKVNMQTDIAEGQVDLTGFITVPLSKKSRPKDVTFDITAALSDMSSERFLSGHTVTAQTLSFAAENTKIAISGAAAVDGFPVDIDWDMPISPGKKPKSILRVDLDLTPDVLNNFKIKLPEGLFSGSSPARLKLDMALGRAPRYELSSKTLGSAVSVPALSWRKGTKESGTFFATGQFGDAPSVDELVLEAAGLTARGNIDLDASGKFAALNLPVLKLSNWLDVSAKVLPADKNGNRVALSRGFIDARRFPRSNRKGAPTQLDIQLDKLRITRGISLTSLVSTARTGRGVSGKYKARVNGGARVSGALTTVKTGTQIAMASARAGAVLRDAGIFKSLHDGDLTMKLTPTGTEGDFNFEFRISKTKLRDSGPIAELLDAISVVGLLQKMGGEGIHFENIEGFGKIRENGIRIDRISATGASMGITVRGWYAPKSQTVDFEGVVTPIYAINGTIQRLFGKIMGRHKGEGLFGFTYRAKGKAAAPKISVNPLSILTPGAFREIFRADPPPPPSQ